MIFFRLTFITLSGAFMATAILSLLRLHDVANAVIWAILSMATMAGMWTTPVTGSRRTRGPRGRG